MLNITNKYPKLPINYYSFLLYSSRMHSKYLVDIGANIKLQMLNIEAKIKCRPINDFNVEMNLLFPISTIKEKYDISYQGLNECIAEYGDRIEDYDKFHITIRDYNDYKYIESSFVKLLQNIPSELSFYTPVELDKPIKKSQDVTIIINSPYYVKKDQEYQYIFQFALHQDVVEEIIKCFDYNKDFQSTHTIFSNFLLEINKIISNSNKNNAQTIIASMLTTLVKYYILLMQDQIHYYLIINDDNSRIINVYNFRVMILPSNKVNNFLSIVFWYMYRLYFYINTYPRYNPVLPDIFSKLAKLILHKKTQIKLLIDKVQELIHHAMNSTKEEDNIMIIKERMIKITEVIINHFDKSITKIDENKSWYLENEILIEPHMEFRLSNSRRFQIRHIELTPKKIRYAQLPISPVNDQSIINYAMRQFKYIDWYYIQDIKEGKEKFDIMDVYQTFKYQEITILCFNVIQFYLTIVNNQKFNIKTIDYMSRMILFTREKIIALLSKYSDCDKYFIWQI